MKKKAFKSSIEILTCREKKVWGPKKTPKNISLQENYPKSLPASTWDNP